MNNNKTMVLSGKLEVKTMDIFEYAEEIILSMGGNGADVEQITEEIKESGYTTIEEVKSHLENYYIGGFKNGL